MNKEELIEAFQKDFKKSQGALEEVIEHNRRIDNILVEDLAQGDFKKLEEHIEITKLIVDGVKAFNDLYKNVPVVLSAIGELKGEEK